MHEPVGAAQAGAALGLPGDARQRNGRQQFSHLAAGPRAHGWSVAMPGYSLAPAASLTAIVAEVRAALDWLAAHGPEHGVEGPVVVSGWSAGAHLAVLALDHPTVVAGLGISGIYDLAPLADTTLNTALALTTTEVEQLSPIRRSPSPRPLILAYGTAELPALIGDSIALYNGREAALVPTTLLPVTEADHFTILEQLERPDGVLTEAVLVARSPAVGTPASCRMP